MKDHNSIEKICDVIIVTYNSTTVIEECIRTLYKFNSVVINRVFVIDNNSSDKTLSLVENLQSDFTRLEIHKLEKNLGFAAANNIGAKLSDNYFIALINPDVVFNNNGLHKLVIYMLKDRTIGAGGPSLIFPNGIVQGGFGARIGLFDIMIDFILGGKLKAKILNRRRNKPVFVDWVSGACLLVRNDVFATVGGFDENIFMYSEDLDLCLRIKKAGYNILYNPDIKIIHIGGVSQKTNKIEALQANIASRFYYISKYFGRSHLLILTIFMVFFLLARLLAHMLLSVFYVRHREYFRVYKTTLFVIHKIHTQVSRSFSSSR